MFDKMKYEIYLEHADKYLPWELEENLQNFKITNVLKEKEEKISELYDKIEELEEKLNPCESTLNNDLKLDVFLEYNDKYSPWEFEELLKNGHLLLGKSK